MGNFYNTTVNNPGFQKHLLEQWDVKGTGRRMDEQEFTGAVNEWNAHVDRTRQGQRVDVSELDDNQDGVLGAWETEGQEIRLPKPRIGGPGSRYRPRYRKVEIENDFDRAYTDLKYQYNNQGFLPDLSISRDDVQAGAAKAPPGKPAKPAISRLT